MSIMKGIVVYDTYYGNTKKVAEAIADQIRAQGHEAELRSLREKHESPPDGDFMFIGSPIRFARVSRRTRRFVRKIDRESWRNKPMAIFVTVAPPLSEPTDEKKKASVQKWVYSGGPKLRDLGKVRDLNVVDKVLHVSVKNSRGPLVDGWVDQVNEHVSAFVSAMTR